MASKNPERIDSHFRQHIESKYSPISRDDHEKLIDGVIGLIEYGRDRRQSLHSFLEQASRLIFRFFALDEIVIGLYDRKQKDFYHEVIFGYRNDLAAEFKRLRYDYDDMVSQDKFPSIKTGKLSELNPVEGLPETERKLFNRPFMGADSRKALDQFHEGDYIDFWMRDSRKNLIGWIEVSHPRDSKLPARINVMWLEFITSICASVVCQRWYLEDRARGVTANGH